jgi:hypothetical protein
MNNMYTLTKCECNSLIPLQWTSESTINVQLDSMNSLQIQWNHIVNKRHKISINGEKNSNLANRHAASQKIKGTKKTQWFMNSMLVRANGLLRGRQ